MDNLKEEKIKDHLKNFRERTGVIHSILISKDGFLIAIDQEKFNGDIEFYQSLGAIFAGIDSMATSSVGIINPDNNIRRISIQAGDQLDKEGFTIILESVTKDITLSIIFPTYLNLGVILFELNQIIQKLTKYFSNLLQTESVARKSIVNN